MRLPRNLGMILLAVWLILTGVLPFLNIGVPGVVLSLLALAAGVLILLGR